MHPTFFIVHGIKKSLLALLGAVIFFYIAVIPLQAQTSPTLTNVPSTTPTPSFSGVGCTVGSGYVNETVRIVQGKQLNGLPLPASRSDTSYAYGPADSLFYSLGRAGTVTFKYPGEIENIPGSEISIYETTNGRMYYPLETARVAVSDDNLNWYTLSVLASSRINSIGLNSFDINETGLSRIRYIQLTDIINPANTIPDSDGIDINSVGALSQVCPTPSPTPTLTTTLTPSPTKTPTPTTTPTPTEAPPMAPSSCVNGAAWLGLGVASTPGTQLNGLPVGGYHADPSYAYGAADALFYSLGRGGSVTYAFPGVILNTDGPDLNIYEVSNGRMTYPLETATVDVSNDNTTWHQLSVLASSRANTLGISELDFAETGLPSIKYIRLTDIPNPLNTLPESDGFDLNAIGVTNQECVTPTPTPTPTATPTNTPTPTPSATPTPTLSPIPITVDFGNKIASGSPLIFGGANFPDHRHIDAWNKIADVGVTMIRRDLFPEYETPQGITLLDYQNNVNDVQNVAKWNKIYIDTTDAVLQQAKSRNMTTMAIMAYSPPWLNSCGCRFGIPKDWAVYKDIVKKVYRNHRPLIDYIEVWNEPTWPATFDLTNSGLSAEQAYVQMFKTASAGIREVDAEINDGRHIPIGGLVASSPVEYPMLNAMLADPQVVANLDFISYHDYHQNVPYPSWSGYKTILQNAGLGSTPVYMTEWSYFYDDKVPTPFNGGPESISFTGKKFTQFMKMGLKIAQFHSLVEVNQTRPNIGAGTYGFYLWNAATSTATLREDSKTWRLMSKTLGLGAGSSDIFSASASAGIASVGFTNSVGKKGIVVVNEASSEASFLITAQRAGPVSASTLFQASATSDGGMVPVSSPSAQINGTNYIWRIFVPRLSVSGLLLE